MEQRKFYRVVYYLVIVFFALTMILGLSFWIIDTLTVKRPTMLSYATEKLTDWVQVVDGDRIPFQLPCEFDLEDGEPLIMETTLPEYIYGDMWIDYFSARHSVFYVDGERRFEHPAPEKFTVAGGIVKSLHIYVPVYPSDSGKTLRIERTGEPANGGELAEIYVGTALGLVEQILSRNIVHFVMTLSLIVIAILLIVIGFVLRLAHKGNPHISSVGIGVLFVSIWLILDSELYQFAFRNYYVDGTLSYIATSLMPIPFIFYVDVLQKHRYSKALVVEVCLYQIVTVTLTALHFTNTISFSDTLPVMAVSETLVILSTGVTLAVDVRKKLYKEYFLSFLGLLGFAVSGIMELLLIFSVPDRIDGDALIWGLYFLLIMAVFQEIIFMREVEKVRNMAILASEAKTNFLANMSHEIRTPMNAILGMCEMILRESDDENKVVKYAGDIKSAGALLLSVINDILDITKVESGKAELIMGDFEICSVLNDIGNIALNRASEKDLAFVYNVSESIPYRFYGDEMRIRQVILNVVNNAVKYTNKGSITVDVAFEYAGGDLAGDRGTLHIKVTDTGIGIRKEDIGKLFSSFSRLEETRNRNIEGTGLGLYITYTYVTMMGGTIDVESVYSEGSVFTLNIPLKVTDHKVIGKYSDAIKAFNIDQYEYKPIIMAPNARVLVVDDNEMNISVVTALMKDTKIKIDKALSGAEAIEKVRDNNYDLVFLDQMMPGMDGIQTLKILKESYGYTGTPIIALTADAIAGAKDFYLNNGFTDYLSKPIKPEELEKTLSKYMPKRLLLSRDEIMLQRSRNGADVIDESELKSLLIVDPNPEVLRELREKLGGVFKSTLVTDVRKAQHYLDKHSVDYVLVDGKLYVP